MHMEDLHKPELLLSWRDDNAGQYDGCVPKDADMKCFPLDQALGKLYKPTRYVDDDGIYFWEWIVPCCGRKQCAVKPSGTEGDIHYPESQSGAIQHFL